MDLKPWLMGKDPLEIEAPHMGRGTTSLSGTRTEGSAHQTIRAVSGIEIALWDLAGKLLDVPVVILLGGKYRDKVRMYWHPAEMGKHEIEQFLNHPAVAKKMAASTQNQALSALVFLYREVLDKEIGWMDNLKRQSSLSGCQSC